MKSVDTYCVLTEVMKPQAIKAGSEAFFYWPPEEIADYTDWCEVSARYRRKRILKAKQYLNLQNKGD